MDNRYIFAAVKDMKLVIKDFAGGVESIDIQVRLEKPKQYITHEELKALGDLVKKHINNLREDVEKEICTAMDEKEWGDREFENRLDDKLFQFKTTNEMFEFIKQAEGEAECLREMEEEGFFGESTEPQMSTCEYIDRCIKNSIIREMCAAPEIFEKMPSDYSFEFTPETIDEVAAYIAKIKEEAA